MACNLHQGKGPSSSCKDSLESDARIDEAYLVAPTNLAGWEAAEQWGWLVKTWGRLRGRFGVSPTTGAPPPWTPEWGGVISGQYWGTLWSGALSLLHQSDWIQCACLPSRNADLVERTAGGPLAIMTAQEFAQKVCMPHLRCQRHVIGKKVHIMTTPLCWHILSIWGSIGSCCPLTWGSAAKTANSPSHARALHLWWGHAPVLGERRSKLPIPGELCCLAEECGGAPAVQ